MARLGSGVAGRDEAEVLESLFSGAVKVGIAADLIDDTDSRLTLLTLCNQIVRFCPTVLLDVPDEGLAEACINIAESVDGERHQMRLARMGDHGTADLTIMVASTNPRNDSIVVTSEGWVARLASGATSPSNLRGGRRAPNAIGAIAAACMGTGELFLRLIGLPAVVRNVELTLLTGESGPIGVFHPGPELPDTDLVLDGLLAGCGGVGTAWAYAVKHLRIAGKLKAVDRQRLGSENVGPYAVARWCDIGKWKAKMVKRYLALKVDVTAFYEEFDLFEPRIREFANFATPSLVVCGFDTATARHEVQRLWPETLIDLAAGGATAQVHVHRAGKGGQCLLDAHTAPVHELSFAERVSQMTGISPERIRDSYNQPITEADVVGAPKAHQATLEAARCHGELICGRISKAHSSSTEENDDFAPAAPFVAGLAGVMGASLTLQSLVGADLLSGLHWQYNFQSGRSRRLEMVCRADCECQRLGT
jgi:molybdopterin/thiamine biosynthesis adenylyltransferase